MAIDIPLPKLGDDIDSGEISEILVEIGATVEQDEILIEVVKDKASAQITSPSAGTVSAIHVSEGDDIAVGTVMISIEAAAGSAPAAEPAAAAPAAAPTPPPEPAPAPAAPAPAQPVAATPPPTPVAPVAPAPAAPAPVAPSAFSNVPAGPAIRRFAREVGVDLTNVKGSGEGGRILREDVLNVVRTGSRLAPSNGAQSASSNGSGTTDEFGPVRYEKMSHIRKLIANQMHASWSQCPRVTNFDDADVTDLEEFRQASKADYAAQGLKLTSMPFIIKAFAMALRNNPSINASINMETGQIIYKEYVNIGIAVDSDAGLMVPVLKDADKLSIPNICRGLDDLVDKVRDGKISPDEMKGGTFSISNLGAIGGQYSTPIINIPETAIILVGRSRKLPVVVGNEIVPRLMMPLSLSYDHRLIDGAMAARFLNDAIGFLNAPSRILMAP